MSDENYGDIAFRLAQEVLSKRKSKPSDVIKTYLQCHHLAKNISQYQQNDGPRELETLFNEMDGLEKSIVKKSKTTKKPKKPKKPKKHAAKK